MQCEIDSTKKVVAPVAKRAKLNGCMGFDVTSFIRDADESNLNMSNEPLCNLDEIRNVCFSSNGCSQRENDIAVRLQVARFDVPSAKPLNKDIVHLFLCEQTAQSDSKTLKLLSDKIGTYVNEKKIPPPVTKLMLRATVWDANLSDCKKIFKLGDIIEIKKVSALKTFNGMVQFNCNLKNIMKAEAKKIATI